jgi:L-iditol 2-dehydrogenase
VAIHALDLARLKPMASVAIIGAGPIGLLMLQVARCCGAGQVIVIDPLEYRQKVAADLGANATASSWEAVRDRMNGRGVDVVLEATTSPLGPQHAAEAVRIGGSLILVGIPEGDQFTLNASLVRRKGLTIKMSRRMGNVYPRAIQMVQNNKVNVEPLMTHRFGLEQAPEAFELHAAYRDEVLKSMIFPRGIR